MNAAAHNRPPVCAALNPRFQCVGCRPPATAPITAPDAVALFPCLD